MRENHAVLTLGPVLFLWDGPQWRDFYFRIAEEAPVDVVFLGEVVCSKRKHFAEPYISEVVERLCIAGKEIVLSSLALATQQREIEYSRECAEQGEFLVEANDLSILPSLVGKAHAVGPSVNVYNAMTANYLASRGARSICLPPELPLASIAAIAHDLDGADVEVFAYGRDPLAISARCAHARARGKSKDNCQFACAEDPDGLSLTTMSGEPFLAINSVQTMSHSYHCIIGELDALARSGVRRFRLSPQKADMVEVARIYRAALSGEMDVDEARTRLIRSCPSAVISNGFLHGASGADYIARGQPTAGR